MASSQRALLAVGAAGIAGLLIIRMARAKTQASPSRIREVARIVLSSNEPPLIPAGSRFDELRTSVRILGKPHGMDPNNTGGFAFGPVWPAEWDRTNFWWIQYRYELLPAGTNVDAVLQVNLFGVPVDVYHNTSLAAWGVG